VSTCCVPGSPTRPAPWPWTSTRVGPAARRRRSRDAGQAAALGSDQPLCEPGTANTAPSLPVRPSAGRRPRRPQTTGARRPAAPGRGGPPHRATPGSSADRAAAAPRTPERVRPDTWMHRTPGHRTPGRWTPGRWTPGRWTSARPVGRTSSRRDWGRGQGNDRPGRRPDISSRPATTRWAARPGPGHGAWGALGHPGRLRGDGTCTAALTAAATGQLPSTARHEAAPRRTALLRRWIESKAERWLPSGTWQRVGGTGLAGLVMRRYGRCGMGNWRRGDRVGRVRGALNTFRMHAGALRERFASTRSTGLSGRGWTADRAATPLP
jgi:hypothetical protein